MIYVGYEIFTLYLIICLYTVSYIIYEKVRIQYTENKIGIVYYQCYKFADDNG